jgi:SSS family solute:Na+ symporter
LGKQTAIAGATGSSVFMNTIQTLTNPYMSAFVACAVLMAVLSTAISLLNAVSSNLSQDFEFGSQDGQKVHLSRKITALIGLAAVGGSFYAGEIVSLLIQSYELSVYCLFIPVCAALFKQKGNSSSAWSAFAWGGVTFFLTRNYSLPVPKEILCLAASGIGYVSSELWLKFNVKSTECA